MEKKKKELILSQVVNFYVLSEKLVDNVKILDELNENNELEDEFQYLITTQTKVNYLLSHVFKSKYWNYVKKIYGSDLKSLLNL